MTSEGNKLLLNKNSQVTWLSQDIFQPLVSLTMLISQHYILRSDCESLIRQGILEHVIH